MQLSYLQSFFPNEFVAFNFGGKEYGVVDTSILVESKLAAAWPLKSRGRRLWMRACEASPLAFWRNNHLTERGRRFVRKAIKATDCDHALVVVDSERTACRFNSIQEGVERPYSVVLYDLVHCDVAKTSELAELKRCIANARHVFAISEPLEDVAKQLGATSVSPIGFFRPPVSTLDHCQNRPELNPIRILVLGHAAPGPLSELEQALIEVASSHTVPKLELNYVGAPIAGLNFESSNVLSMIDHGIVSNEQRDQIGASCDFAILAGPANDVNQCPFAKYSIPSKMGDFAAFGLPFIARVSEGSAAQRFIESEISDFALIAGSKGQLTEQLRWMIENPSQRVAMGKNAMAFARRAVLLPAAAGDFRSELAN